MSQEPQPIPADTMHRLLVEGQAYALLDEYFPVPVKVADSWWCVPSDATNDDFFPATTSQAAMFEALAARRRTAAAAVALGDESLGG